MIHAHAVGGDGQRLALLGAQAVERKLQLALRQLERHHGLNVEPVEAAGVFDHRGVAGGANRLQDLGDRGVDAAVGLGLEGEQGVERGQEFGFARVEAADRRLAHERVLTMDRAGEGVEHRLQQFALELERGLVDDQARADRHDVLDLFQVVGRSVPPVDTRSTIASASPTRGASSIEP